MPDPAPAAKGGFWKVTPQGPSAPKGVSPKGFATAAESSATAAPQFSTASATSSANEGVASRSAEVLRVDPQRLQEHLRQLEENRCRVHDCVFAYLWLQQVLQHVSSTQELLTENRQPSKIMLTNYVNQVWEAYKKNEGTLEHELREVREKVRTNAEWAMGADSPLNSPLADYDAFLGELQQRLNDMAFSLRGARGTLEELAKSAIDGLTVLVKQLFDMVPPPEAPTDRASAFHRASWAPPKPEPPPGQFGSDDAAVTKDAPDFGVQQN